MANSSFVVTDDTMIECGIGSISNRCRKITLTWVGDDATGAVPNLNLPLYGFVAKIIFNPSGVTAPTANYDFVLGSDEDSALDEAFSAGLNLSATTTSVNYPTSSGGKMQSFLAGTYTLQISGNSVASASGRIIIYMIDGY